MRRVYFWVGILGLTLFFSPHGAGRPAARAAESSLSGKPFKVAGLTFLIPWRWAAQPVPSATRVGRWLIPSVPGQDGEGAELVIFFFGPGIGGTPQENFDAWSSLVTGPDGHTVSVDLQKHEVAGFKITQATFFGTYSKVVPFPGLPPVLKTNYGLSGAVVENPQGNLYWQLTGPAPLVTATLPLFGKVIDSVKGQDKP